jgi:hypothetical protein
LAPTQPVIEDLVRLCLTAPLGSEHAQARATGETHISQLIKTKTGTLSDSIWIQIGAISILVSVSTTLDLSPRVGSSLDHSTLTAVVFARIIMAETAAHTPSQLPGPQAIILSIHSLQLGLAIIILCLDVYGVHYIPHHVLACSLIIASD